jgi:predicted Rossmann fold nucleotide-binding protein DprA/Smf involved in DNA uptake
MLTALDLELISSETVVPTHQKCTVIGNRALFDLEKIAVFCSSKCPGRGILAAKHRFEGEPSDGIVYIGGFQTDVERMCMSMMLRNGQNVIMFPARSIRRMRIPAEWQEPINRGRFAIASSFPDYLRRPRREDCRVRNEIVASIASRVIVVACDPESRLTRQVAKWQANGMAVEPLAS